MLHAAAMLAGLFVLGLLMTQGWALRETALLVFAASLATLGVALRFGGVAATPFAVAPQFIVLIAGRAKAVLGGAFSTMRAAVAADVTLAPALVRVRLEAPGVSIRAAAANLISAAPGNVVVDTDSEGMLVHVINEDASDAAAFSAIEGRAARVLGRRR